MKPRPINIVELILFILFSVSIFLRLAHIPFLSWTIAISCMTLGCLYWPLGFYTLRLPGVKIAYAVAASLLFSFSLVIIMFRVLKWPGPPFTFEVLVGIYLAVFLAILGAYLFAKDKEQLIKSNKGLLIRFAVYFLLTLYALMAYKSIH